MKTQVLWVIAFWLTIPVVKAQTKIEGVSAPVQLNIRKKKLPPILNIKDIRFEDADGNNRIDGRESCMIVFTIENSGTGPAVGMTMKITQNSTVRGLIFNETAALDDIQPGNSLPITVPLKSGMDLSDGTAVFNFSFEEPLGFPPDGFTLNVATKAFQSPLVKVADYLFITDNGIIKTGLPVQLKVLVQNTGQGKAEDVKVNFNYPQVNVYPNSDEQFSLGTMNPNETKDVVFEFLPNKKYTNATIPVQIRLSEKYGRYAENKTAVATVDSRTENRTIAVTSTAIDQKVTITEAALTAEVDRNIPENPVKNPNRYALVIGNEDYKKYQPGLNSESNVPFAVSDAQIFARYAEKTLGTDPKNIVVLENVISTEMTREIERLSKIIEYSDGQAEVVIFYSGHGNPEEVSRESYLMPVNISGTEVSKGIPLRKLYADLTRFPAKRVTIFLDACFSGGGREAGLLAARGVRIKPKEDEIAGNLVVFTASSGEQSALSYKEKQHGMFTYFLLKSLQESKGNITYNVLFNQIKQKVQLNSIKINSKDQNPNLIYSGDVADKLEEWKIY